MDRGPFYSCIRLRSFEGMLREHIALANDYGVLAAHKICDEYATDDGFL